jgi:hypothetical protein
MIELLNNSGNFSLQFTKEDFSDEFLKRLLRKFQVEKILGKSKLTESQAWELSEQVKEDWWNENKGWILEKLGITDENNS